MSGVHVFGSINTDLVVYVPRLPHPGETVSGGEFAVYPGGKGANSAVAASRAGARVRIYGAVGDDTYGRDRAVSLAEEGVDTTGVVVKTGSHSGIAQIWVGERGENSIAVAPGANALFAAEDVVLDRVERGGVAAFQNEVPQAATETLIGALKERGCITIWNVAPECRVRPRRETLTATDYLVLNENELKGLAGVAGSGIPAGDYRGRMSPERAAEICRGLLEVGARRIIVTLGIQGSILVDAARKLHRQPAFRVEAVDTVGAGDCYAGVFAASLAAGMEPEAAMRRAAAAAAVSVTRRGAQTSMPAAQEIDDMLAAGAT